MTNELRMTYAVRMAITITKIFTQALILGELEKLTFQIS